jgi:hypothetical protein
MMLLTKHNMTEPSCNRFRCGLRGAGWLALAAAMFAGSTSLLQTSLLAQDNSSLQAALPDVGAPPVPPSPDAPPATAAADGVGVDEVGVGEVTVESELTELSEPTEPSKATVSQAAESQAAESQADESQAATVRTLSVEPRTRPLLPANSPAWITAAPDFSSAVHRLPVGSLPTNGPEETDGALDEPLRAALYDYVDSQVIQQPGASERLHEQLSTQYIRRNLIEDPAGYTAELTTSNGAMYQKWVMVSITPEQREQLRAWHREALQRDRLAPLGLGVVAAIGFIGLSHMVLRRMYGLPKTKPITSQNYVALPIHLPPVVQQEKNRVQHQKKSCCGFGGAGKPIVLGLFIVFAVLGTMFFSVVERKQQKQQKRRVAEVEIRMADLQSATTERAYGPP